MGFFNTTILATGASTIWLIFEIVLAVLFVGISLFVGWRIGFAGYTVRIIGVIAALYLSAALAGIVSAKMEDWFGYEMFFINRVDNSIDVNFSFPEWVRKLFGEYIDRAENMIVGRLIARTVMFFVLTVILNIVIVLFSKLVNSIIRNIPILGFLNNIVGAIISFVLAFTVLSLIFYFLAVFGADKGVAEAFDNSVIFGWVYDYNFFGRIINGLAETVINA